MTNPHGSFIWYELMTSDSAPAQRFYAAVAGWEMRDAGMPNMAYTLASAAGVDVAGLAAMPAEAGTAPPAWFGYIGVDDVDAAAAGVTAAGGAIHHGPADIPGVGRFAMAADPQGAMFGLLRTDAAAPSRSYELGTPGHFGWNELHTRDADAALDFYCSQFGWTRGEPMPMGEMGFYRIFEIGGAGAGAAFDSPDVPRPMWLFYICTPDVDAALERVTVNGGEVLLYPTEVPNDMFIVQARDPQGAMFALVGPRGRQSGE